MPNKSSTTVTSKFTLKQKKRFNWKALLGAVVLFVVIAGAAIGVFLSQKNQELRNQAAGSGRNCDRVYCKGDYAYDAEPDTCFQGGSCQQRGEIVCGAGNVQSSNDLGEGYGGNCTAQAPGGTGGSGGGGACPKSAPTSPACFGQNPGYVFRLGSGDTCICQTNPNNGHCGCVVQDPCQRGETVCRNGKIYKCAASGDFLPTTGTCTTTNKDKLEGSTNPNPGSGGGIYTCKSNVDCRVAGSDYFCQAAGTTGLCKKKRGSGGDENSSCDGSLLASNGDNRASICQSGRCVKDAQGYFCRADGVKSCLTSAAECPQGQYCTPERKICRPDPGCASGTKETKCPLLTHYCQPLVGQPSKCFPKIEDNQPCDPNRGQECLSGYCLQAQLGGGFCGYLKQIGQTCDPKFKNQCLDNSACIEVTPGNYQCQRG